ncbi:MAG: choice-of-anchor Q domain-containing protein, partial [Bacteroidota bacterium]
MKRHLPNLIWTHIRYSTTQISSTGRSPSLYVLSTLIISLFFLGTPSTLNKDKGRSASAMSLMTACDNGLIYVDADAAGGGDGTAWGSAYNKLQDALNEACACSNPVEIWVADGIYYPDEGIGIINNDRTNTFELCEDVAVYGGFDGIETMRSERDIENNLTVLSGDIDQNDSQTPVVTDISTLTGNGSNAYTVVSAIGSSITNTTILDGFTITAGRGEVFTSVDEQQRGGGMYNRDGASPNVSNVKIQGNAAQFGGGVYNQMGRPQFTNVIISGNLNPLGAGGGMYNDNTSPRIINSIISGNEAGSSDGGGIFSFSSTLQLINTLITGNKSARDGGGFATVDGSTFITNCAVSGNFATADGGGIYNENAFGFYSNCIVWNNESNGSTDTPDATITNIASADDVSFRNSIVANALQGGFWNVVFGFNGGNNKDENPFFLTPTLTFNAPTSAGDFRVFNFSPAINMGSNTIDLDGTLSGTELISDIPTDLDGNTRIQETTIDIGAYEQLSLACPTGPNAVVYVNQANGTAGDGSTWGTAFDNLQDGLTKACFCSSVTEIWVAQGTYYPDEGLTKVDNDRNSTFELCPDVAIYGGFDGTETMLSQRDFDNNVTILSGDIDQNDNQTPVVTDISTLTGNGTNAYNVVKTFGGSIDNSTILDGFTVTAGNADLESISLTINRGAGMFNDDFASPTVANVKFLGNSARFGAGIFNEGGSPSFKNIVVSGNLNPIGAGGGMYNIDGTVRIENSIISGNEAGTSDGGGIFTVSGRLQLINTLITGNKSGRDGGGLANTDGSTFMTNCVVSGNLAVDDGGGMYNDNAGGNFSNSIFWNNEASGFTTTINATASVFAANSVFTNCIVANTGGSSSWDFSFTSDGGIDGGNNKDETPLFLNAILPSAAPTSAGDFQVFNFSSAINMGDNTIDLDGTLSGTELISDIPTDIDGNTRIQETTIDIGAYEQPGLACPSGPNARLYVNQANGTPGDGLTWGTAYNKLQDALIQACFCSTITEIWVAQGTYYPDEGLGQIDNDRNSTFELCSDVAVYGGFDGTESMLSERDFESNLTVLSGDIDQNDSQTPVVTNLSALTDNENNAYTVVTSSGNSITNTTILDGFTITAGKGETFTSVDEQQRGGGMYNIEEASPTISNVKILGNVAQFGGGVYNDGGTPIFDRVNISDNTASAGGGMYNASPNFTRLRIINSIISGNEVIGDGGGIISFDARVQLINTLITGNKAAQTGGGLESTDGTTYMTNCVVSGNSAGLNGGGMENDNSEGNFSNTIFWNNEAAGVTNTISATMRTFAASPRFKNSIVANSGGSSSWDAGFASDGAVDDGGNKDVDPLFVSGILPSAAPTASGDFRLQEASTGINMGDNTIDLDGLFFGTETIADIPTDLDGNMRIIEAIIDIGAYENLGCASRLGIPVAIASDQYICGDMATLDGSNPGTATGEWTIISGDGNGYFGNTPGTMTSSDPTSTFTGTRGVTYTLQWRIFQGDCETTAQITIDLQEDPTIANAGNNQNVCGGSTFLLANTPTVGTGMWMITGVADGGGVISSPANPTSAFSGNFGQTYTLTWTISNGVCTESTDEVEITFFDNPTTAAAGANQNTCNNNITLAANAASGFQETGAWSEILGDGNGVFDDETDPTTTFSGTGGVTYTLRWSISNGVCPLSSDDVEVTIIDIPTVIADEITRCDGDVITLADHYTVDYTPINTETPTIQIYDSEANALAGGATGLLANQTTQTVSPSNNSFWVRAEVTVNGETCFDVDEISVIVLPLPEGEISFDDDRICDMETAELMLNLTVGRYPVEIVVEAEDEDGNTITINGGNPIPLADANDTYTIDMDEYELGLNTYTLKSITENIGGDNQCTTTDINQSITLLVELPTIIDAAAETYYIQPCEDDTDFLYSILITEKCETSLADADEVEISGDAALVNALVSKTATNINDYSFNVEFDFEDVPMGNHSITFSYEKSKGGRFSATTTITVEAAPDPNVEDLACNDDVFVTLGEACTAEVTADMVLDGDNICNDLFTVIVDYGMGMKSKDEIIDCGKFKYEVYLGTAEGEADFVCWGYITGEDKYAPKYDETEEPYIATITCTDIDSILKYSVADMQLKKGTDINGMDSCYFAGKSWDILENQDAFFVNEIYDNCTQYCHLDFTINDVLMDGDICAEDIANRPMIQRTIRVTDEKGNTETFIVRFIAEQIELFFDEVTVDDSIDLCTYPDAGADNFLTKSGNPYWYSYCIDEEGNRLREELDDRFFQGSTTATLCNLAVGYEDTELPIECDGKKIIRKWSVLNWCEEEPFNLTEIGEQLIKVGYFGEPTVSANGMQADEVSTGAFDCTATLTVLPPNVSGCKGGNFDYTIKLYQIIPETDGFGILTGNNIEVLVSTTITQSGDNYIATDLPIGDYKIQYFVTNECGINAEGEFVFSVKDLTEPVPVVDDELNVSIGGDGIGRVCVDDVDEGSWDNCELLSTDIRRELWEEACRQAYLEEVLEIASLDELLVQE